MKSWNYIVISPARNEENNIEHTIRSMVGQSVRPKAWVIVDDGSTDKTPAILDAAAKEYPWIKVVHRTNRGFRKQGGGVIEAFYDGFKLIESEAWDFLVKFDSDLSFEPDYFEKCLRKFDAEPKLGIGGGMISQEVEGKLVCESPGDPAFHVRGAVKIYRHECWKAIGGLLKAPGWDTVDEIKANMLGWTTYTFKDIPIRHHRITGSADGTWKNYVKFGLANYITGYHPVFMGFKCLKRLKERPYIIGAVGLAWGFFGGYQKRVEQIQEPEVIRYVRQQQLRRLIFKKSLWT